MNYLFRAYKSARRQELQELGQVIAYAYHEPGKLKDLLRPDIRELAHRATQTDDAWDTDEWWQGQQ